jgi:hypothetical protein
MEAVRTLARRLADGLRALGGVRLLVLLLGVLGAVLVMAAELSTIVRVEVLTAGTCEEIADSELRDSCDTSGFEQHGGAFFLIGAVAIAMAIGAARGASRPAALALIVLGAIVLVISLSRDVPKADETGRVGLQFEEAEAQPGRGLYLEVIGGGLIALAGLRGVAQRRERD